MLNTIENKNVQKNRINQMSHFNLPLLTYNCKLYNTQNIHFDYLVGKKGGGRVKKIKKRNTK